MPGLRYRAIGPFTAARKMKLNGVQYQKGDVIADDVVAGLRNLDALLSNRYINSRRGPFTNAGRKVFHVPPGVRRAMKVTEPPPADPETVPTGTVAEVLEWVGSDLVRAQAALDAELLAETPRSTLVSALEALLAAPGE